jgi:hypothetical protein
MDPRRVATLTLALLLSAACRSTPQPVSSVEIEGSPTTSPLGHGVLATPIDSTAFAGAQQVDLVLQPQTFSLTVRYASRAPLTMSGTVDLSQTGLLTLVPSAASAEAAAAGFAAGQPFTRVVTASGSTLVLAPPSATVPVPSSVWYRIDAARLAGLVR